MGIGFILDLIYFGIIILIIGIVIKETVMSKYNTYPTERLLNIFVWGDEPLNLNKVEEELEKRGVDLKLVKERVDGIIKNHS